MSSLHLFLFMKPAPSNLKSHVRMLQAWREHRLGLKMQGPMRFADRLGGFAVIGVGVRSARYLMVLCTLSGSGGWRSAWRELWGNPAWKNHFHMERAVWLPRTSREGVVGLDWLLRSIYEQCCLFINYLKWTAGTPSLCGLNSSV